MKKIKLGILFVVALSFTKLGESSATVDMTFEEAYKNSCHEKYEDDFSEVQRLYSKIDGWLGEDSSRTTWLLDKAAEFPRVYSLDFTRQGIDNAFIKALSEKDAFKRVASINLTGNPRITRESIQNIFDSGSLGSMRELSQSSGRYGGPCSEIEIRVGGTCVTKEDASDFSSDFRSSFTIHYRRAYDDVQVSPSAMGIKVVKVLDAAERPYAPGSSGSPYMDGAGNVHAVYVGNSTVPLFTPGSGGQMLFVGYGPSPGYGPTGMTGMNFQGYSGGSSGPARGYDPAGGTGIGPHWGPSGFIGGGVGPTGYGGHYMTGPDTSKMFPPGGRS